MIKIHSTRQELFVLRYAGRNFPAARVGSGSLNSKNIKGKFLFPDSVSSALYSVDGFHI